MERYKDNNGIEHTNTYNAEGKLSSASTYNSSTGDRTYTDFNKDGTISRKENYNENTKKGSTSYSAADGKNYHQTYHKNDKNEIVIDSGFKGFQL